MITHQHIFPTKPAPVNVFMDLAKGDDFTAFWISDPNGMLHELDVDDKARAQIEGYLPYTRNQTRRFGGRS